MAYHSEEVKMPPEALAAPGPTTRTTKQIRLLPELPVLSPGSASGPRPEDRFTVSDYLDEIHSQPVAGPSRSEDAPRMWNDQRGERIGASKPQQASASTSRPAQTGQLRLHISHQAVMSPVSTTLTNSQRTGFTFPPAPHRQPTSSSSSSTTYSPPTHHLSAMPSNYNSARHLSFDERTEAAELGSTYGRDEDEKRVPGSGTANGARRADPPVIHRNLAYLIKKVLPDTLACRLLLLTVILESLIDLAIESNILWRFNREIDSTNSATVEAGNNRRLPIYLVIFGLAHLWQLVLTLIALRTKNTVQIVAVTIFNFAFLGYAVIQMYELRQILGDLRTSLQGDSSSLLTLPLNVLTAVIIAVVSFTSLVLVILTYCIRREFGWQRYRFLGADIQIRKYYQRFQVFECICYFSAFFCAGFGIQFIWLVLQKTDVEYVITWIMFPLSILLLIVGRTAAKYENKVFMAVFGVGLLLGVAYFLFKLVRIWQEAATQYRYTSKSLTVFDVLSMLSLVACMVSGWLVSRDFGKGLKEAVRSNSGSSFLRMLGLRDAQADKELSELKQKRLTIS